MVIAQRAKELDARRVAEFARLRGNYNRILAYTVNHCKSGCSGCQEVRGV